MNDETNNLLREIVRLDKKQKDIAVLYAGAIEINSLIDWEAVNHAITVRWSKSGLERVKRMAWRLLETEDE